MNFVVLSLGSNMGDRRKNLDRARRHLVTVGCTIKKESSVYETEPWGNKNQSSFYNKVIAVESALTADTLMTFILQIETIMGRIRNEKWEPRIIDIDILFFNDEVIQHDHLAIPHPHLHERRFVLEPLAEILPDYIHPVLKKTTSELKQSLQDTSSILKI